MGNEPTKIEVLAWLEHTGRTVSAAISEFWPHAVGEERDRINARIRVWKRRARQKIRAETPPRILQHAPGEAFQRPPPPRLSLDALETQRQLLNLRAEVDGLRAEIADLWRNVRELHLLEATPGDLAASLGARPVVFETEEEFEARLPEEPKKPRRRR